VSLESGRETGEASPCIIKTCVDNVEFQAAHVTPINGVLTLHGHSFKLTLCVSGKLRRSGWVVDFLKLRDVVRSVVSQYDNALLISRRFSESIRVSGNFTVKLMIIDGPPTAENIAIEICREVGKALLKAGINGFSHVEVRLWEGSDFHAEVMCGSGSGT